MMKINEIIQKELETMGVQEIEDINLINNSLYFIKTKTTAYTYDFEEKKLEESIGIEDANENPSCMFTIEEKNKIAEENLKLVHYVLKSFTNTGIDYDELESIGNLGFVKALNSFDKMKGIRFSTFAINCIVNEILFFLRKEKKHMGNISLNKKLQFDGQGNTFTLEETLEDNQFAEKGIDYKIMKEEEKQSLLKAISKLNDEEQYIMLYRYGVNGHKTKTQKELAEALNMSQANVSKIQRNCLKKLKFILKKEANC